MDTAELMKAARLLVDTPEHRAVNQMFRDRAKRALSELGCSALEFAAQNPGASIVELARLLNRGSNALGVLLAAYEEASGNGTVRTTAKEFLIRHIRQQFPNGWSSHDNIGPSIRIGGWSREVDRSFEDEQIRNSAYHIHRHLAFDHQPPEGWRPELTGDQLIDDVFDLYWPIGSESDKLPADGQQSQQ